MYQCGSHLSHSLSYANSPKHVFKTTELTRMLGKEASDVFPVIRRNALFAHPENILVSVIDDDCSKRRELSWRRIMKARQTDKGKNVRYFKIPPLNFDANNNTELIDWQGSKVTEPPLTGL